MGNEEFIRLIYKLLIKLCTPNNKDDFIWGSGGCELLERMKNLASVVLKVEIAGEDDITAVGKGFFRKGVPRIAAHHDRMAGSEGFEVLQILRQMAEKLVLEPQFPKAPNRSDNIQFFHYLLILKYLCKDTFFCKISK